MLTYPIKLTYHVRSYYFGERLIPEMLGKRDARGRERSFQWMYAVRVVSRSSQLAAKSLTRTSIQLR
jgi:hypothetical protein